MTTPEDLVGLILANDAVAVRQALKADPAAALRPDPTQNWPPLHWAVYYGFAGRGSSLREVVEVLLDFVGPVDLHTAALLDRADLAEAALAARPSCVDELDDAGRTALHLAAERGSESVTRVLLEHGADPERRTPDGETALARAAHPGPLKPSAAHAVVDLLRTAGAMVDLHLAALLGDTATLAALLDAEPSCLDETDASGCTALYHAAHNLRLDAVDLLLERGAEVDLARPDGQTPLSTAVLHLWDEDGPAVVERLLAAEPTIDFTTAGQLGLTSRVIELATADPGLLAEPEDGYSCLFLSAGCNQPETVAALLELGADPNLAERYTGATPLHHAAELGFREVCLALLAGGADPVRQDRQGRTAADLARVAGHRGLAEHLQA